MRAVLAAVVLVVLGAAGLVRGAWPQHANAATGTGGQVTVSDVYVVAPVPPTELAAAYFTVTNTTDRADRLLSVDTGAGSTAVIHMVVGGVMSALAGAATVPAHGRLVLSVGRGHLMIGGLFDRLTPGQDVSMTFNFERAGVVSVTAPVVKVGTR